MSLGFECRACGEWHDELPFSYHAEAPAYWEAEHAGDPDSELTTDQCVIAGEHFFVLARQQREGVDLAWVQSLAERLLHG